jgi:hypothetical protein
MHPIHSIDSHQEQRLSKGDIEYDCSHYEDNRYNNAKRFKSGRKLGVRSFHLKFITQYWFINHFRFMK